MPASISLGASRLFAAVLASGRPGRADNPLAAALWMTLAVATLSGLSASAKYAGAQGIDPMQIVFFRNFFCVVWMLPLLAVRGPSLAMTRNYALYGVRIGLTQLSMWFWFSAITMMPLAQLQATGFLSPLFATLVAILYLGERVNRTRWLALAAGFIGALIILRPFGGVLGLGQVLAVCAALSIGVVNPLVKQLTATDDSDKIVFITNLVLTPVSLIPALFVWQWPSIALWPCLAAMGLCACLGHICMVRAFNFADASLVATFDFGRLPFAAAIGILFFGETTDIWTWIGAIVIFTSAVQVTRKEAAINAAGKADVSDPIGLTPVHLKL